MDGDTRAAQAHIDGLPEPRRSQMQHLHDVITTAIPDADVTMFDYSGPMLWMAQAFHDSTTSSDKLLAAIDTVIERVRKEGLDQATLDRARVKMRSGLPPALKSMGIGLTR